MTEHLYLRLVATMMLAVPAILPGWASDPEVRVSEPVAPYLIEADLRALPEPRVWEPGMPIREVPRSYRRASTGKRATETGDSARRDPLADEQLRDTTDKTFATIDMEIEGQPFNGALVPDTVGDVGADYFIQAINLSAGTSYTIYDKRDGSVAAGPFTMSDLASGSRCAARTVDPIVLYDTTAQRWLISEYSNVSNALCVYISQTSDPITGGWYGYGFETSMSPDYPKYGVWSDGYYVTTNELPPKIRVMDRRSMLAGLPAIMLTAELATLSGFGFHAPPPADHDGTTAPPEDAPGIVVRHVDDELHRTPTLDFGADYLEVTEIEASFTRGTLSLRPTRRIPIADFDSRLCGTDFVGCVPQPEGMGPALDPIREVIMWRLVYRNMVTHESLLGNFSIDVDGENHAGIRWFELRKYPRDGVWRLHQQGTHAPDDTHRWIGSPAMDAFGNIALGYNVSDSNSVFPGIRYAGRSVRDPLGTLPQGEHTVIEGTAANNNYRYGDYASMSVDPVDDCTFWLTSQYNAAETWSTRIASFRFEACACPAPEPPSGLSALPDGDNRVTIGWDAVDGATHYQVYRALGDCPRGTYDLIASEVTGTTYTDTGVTGGTPLAYAVRAYVADLSCLSRFSACVATEATGACFRKPSFDGIVAASNLGRATCSIEIDWVPAISRCSGEVRYNLYRGTSPDFTPGPETLIASCLEETTFTDQSIEAGVTYSYLVGAEEASGSGEGPCNDGGETIGNQVFSAVATGPDAIGFNDDLESGGDAWSLSTGPEDVGTEPWTLTTSGTGEKGTTWFCSDEAVVKDQRVSLATSIAITAGSRLEFAHAYQLEASAGVLWDGGALEYSTDEGARWHDILAGNGAGIPARPDRFLQNGYDGTISSDEGNPLAGREAFGGEREEFVTTVVDLADFAGEHVLFRFRLGCDRSVSAMGWWVDGLRIIEPIAACIPKPGRAIPVSPVRWLERVDTLEDSRGPGEEIPQ